MTSQNDRRQSSNCKVDNLVMMLILSALITLNVASGFGVHHVNKLGKQSMGGIRNIPMRKSSGQNIFAHNADGSISAHGDANDVDDDGAFVFDQGDGEKDIDAAPPIKIICNGTTDGYIVTKLYNVPLAGFLEDDEVRSDGSEEDTKLPMSLFKMFSTADVTRLRLEPQNVTLAAALMLLDPEQYPTQSRARKIIRQRSICIIRQHDVTDDVSSLNFTELGQVIKRIHPGDVIGVQRRVGSDYYATQGALYRAPPFEVPVVYEDDHMAIINKPAGIRMYRAQGGRGGGGHTLLSALPYVLTPSNVTNGIEFADENGTQNYPLERPQTVHRLDRPTSGLMIVAKTKVALKHLAQQFEYRRARKTYMAIVNGEPISHENEEGSSSEWNSIDHDLEGKSAVTRWRVIRKSQSLHAKDGKLTLVELKPRTGRYHQLRRHMAWVCKSPLVGDTTYDGADESALRLRKRGLFLCSNEIELEHPYYNTPFGRKVFIDMNLGKQIYGETTLWEDADTGKVMIKASTALPDKFESFLEREDSRAKKFEGIYNEKFGETDNADKIGERIS